MLLSRKFIAHVRLFRHINCAACLNNLENNESQINIKSLLDDSASFEQKDPSSDKWSTSVYPVKSRKQGTQYLRPDVDPSTTSIILFPGQGTQYVGMAKSLIEYPNVTEMFESSSEILRYNLLDLCINGPIDMLNMTLYSQAAVMVSSLAAVEKLRFENIQAIENCVATAGFSVGEYSALVFAGAIDFEKAIRLLKIRAEAMQAASDLQSSGMMTVFLTTQSKIKTACTSAREYCSERGIHDAECQIAIHMFPHCKVISGHMEALKYLETNAAKHGIKKIKYIPVSGAFHSKLMGPAKEVLKKALKSTPITTPLIPVHANVDGKPYENANKIRTKLADQLTTAVAWEQTMHAIFERDKGKCFPYTYECGPGTSLKSLLRWNNNLAFKNFSSVLA